MKKYWLHHILVFFILCLIFAHIFAYVFYVKAIKGFFDPFYPFTDLCLICKNVIYPEYFVNFGRIGLWLIGIASLAILFGWRKLHSLNYLAFLFLALHAWLLGSFVNRVPIKYFFTFAVVSILLLVFQKLYQIFKPTKKNS